MTPVNAIRTCLRKYATFTGRASRSEFWWFFAFQLFAYVFLFFLDYAMFGNIALNANFGAAPLSDIFNAAILLPNATVTSRRINDLGYNGIWVAIYSIIIGAAMLVSLSDGDVITSTDYILLALSLPLIIVLLFAIKGSQPGPNKYGPNPHEVPT